MRVAAAFFIIIVIVGALATALVVIASISTKETKARPTVANPLLRLLGKRVSPNTPGSMSVSADPANPQAKACAHDRVRIHTQAKEFTKSTSTEMVTVARGTCLDCGTPVRYNLGVVVDDKTVTSRVIADVLRANGYTKTDDPNDNTQKIWVRLWSSEPR